MPRRKVLTSEESIAGLQAVLLAQIRRWLAARYKVCAPAVGAVLPLLPLARSIRGGRFRSDQEVLLVFCTDKALEQLFQHCLNDYWFAEIFQAAACEENKLPISEAAVQHVISIVRQRLGQVLGQLVGKLVEGVTSPEQLPAALAAHLVDHGAVLLDGNIRCPRLVWNPLFRTNLEP